MLAEEPFSDRPKTASPVIAAFLRTYNDGLDDELRQDLYPLAALIVGTAGARALEDERASRCLVFAESLGDRLPSGRAAIGLATPEASGTRAAHAALRTGPTADVHGRALALAGELAALGARGRRSWPEWLVGRDPAEVIAHATDRARAGEAGGLRLESQRPLLTTLTSAPLGRGHGPAWMGDCGNAECRQVWNGARCEQDREHCPEQGVAAQG
jgi:hypothetical protein